MLNGKQNAFVRNSFFILIGYICAFYLSSVKISNCKQDNLPDYWFLERKYKIQDFLDLAVYLQNLTIDKRVEILHKWAQENEHDHRVYILCIMLFQSSDGSVVRRPKIGNPRFYGRPDTNSNWPTPPITIYKGIPILIVQGYSMYGYPEKAKQYLEYCIQNYNWTSYTYKIKTKKRIQEIFNDFVQKQGWDKTLSKQTLLTLQSQL